MDEVDSKYEPQNNKTKPQNIKKEVSNSIQDPISKQLKRRLEEIELFQERMEMSEDLGIYWSYSMSTAKLIILLFKFSPNITFHLKLLNNVINISVVHTFTDLEYEVLAKRFGNQLRTTKYYFPKFTKTISFKPPFKIVGQNNEPPQNLENTQMWIKEYDIVNPDLPEEYSI